MSTNRIVILISPVLVGLAGWVVELAGRYLPGHPHMDAGGLTDLFKIGAAAMVLKILLWLKGWQAHEQRGHTGGKAIK